MLEIIYNNGRGRLEINLDSLLPCNAADLERLLSFVNMSSDPAKDAEKIHAHIAAKVQELKSARENSTTKDHKEFYTKEIAKLIKNADKLSRVFNLPEIQDEKNNAEKIIFKPAAFYSIDGKNGHVVLIQRMGWTFEKSGFHFEIYKTGTKKDIYYTTMLSGTGSKLSGGRTRKAAVDMINDDIIDIFNKNPGKIENAKELFKREMINAGYMEPETTPEESKEGPKEEEKIMYSFTNDSITCNTNTYPAVYNVTDTGKIIVVATVGKKENGRPEKKRIEFTSDNEFYAAAAAAAGYVVEVNEEPKEEPKEEIQETPEEIKTEERPENIPAEEPERDPKQARGPVPEKTFIGSTIQGNGWKIYFDGDLQRTRIIIDGDPVESAKKAIDAAGFYYSSNMKSYNKKLTFKAYRAALKLKEELEKIYAA